MTKLVTLHCVTGNHDWQREAQRGRLPFDCPDHKLTPLGNPKISTVTVSKGVQHLHCQTCQEDWTRPSTRGKPPLKCPDCQQRTQTRSQGRRAVSKLLAQFDTAEAKVDHLEANLKAHGLHISQHQS